MSTIVSARSLHAIHCKYLPQEAICDTVRPRWAEVAEISDNEDNDGDVLPTLCENSIEVGTASILNEEVDTPAQFMNSEEKVQLVKLTTRLNSKTRMKVF